MATRMLIDATHEEETRVVVVKGNRVEEFDFETATRRPLKGNIYLARVTRVEPSLQAAFVDFGGNRHGFLAFSEIHPDYYQIPVADRERLKREEAAAAAEDDEDDDEDEDEEEEAGEEGRRRPGSGNAADGGRDRKEAGAGPEGDASARTDDAGQEPAETAAEPQDPGSDIGYAGQAPYAPATPSSALPERSGLRRVARLFGFGAEEAAQRAAGGGDASASPAADESPEAEGREQADAVAAQPGAHDPGSRGDDIPVNDIPDNEIHGSEIHGDASRGNEVHDGDTQDSGYAGSGAEASSQLLAEVDDEDRPAEERDDQVEAFGGDAVDEVRRRSSKRRPLTRRYKIQEVIKRRQILLVQVVKEERGNKGAALTTYLSLAGRYCVLMPNSPNGGGISRKIVSATDRKRLKAITSELDVPEGMGMIVRTAGMERTRAEIKRDFEFLLRTWDNIRELTLASMAPCLVYEEANLIKRAIRDLYNKDIDEVLVEGENGYRHAKDFMKMLMPSHSKRVQPYKDRIPLFHRYQTEAQLDEMFFPTVQLKSGGYIVINATEALVAIDVNSGRSTKEHNIESTAYKTNMEAAEEVARQLRLRDMAGLIVIDFIDMDEGRNARNVERKLKECLKLDRARIQVGRISSFGLLEMSRQRLRPSLVEQSMVVCPHCDGQGHVRSVESAAIRAIRAAEDEGIRERSAEVTLIVPTTVAIYLLNSKRDVLQEIEGRYGMRVQVKNDDELGPSDFNLERSKTRSDGEPPVQKAITAESVSYRGEDDEDESDEDQVEVAVEDEDESASDPDLSEEREPAAATSSDEEVEQKSGGRGKRRRRRRPRREDSGDEARTASDDSQAAATADTDAEPHRHHPEAQSGDDPTAGNQVSEDDDQDEDAEEKGGRDQVEASSDDEDGQSGRRGRRRGRRGGRRRRRRQDREEGTEQAAAGDGDQHGEDDGPAEPSDPDDDRSDGSRPEESRADYAGADASGHQESREDETAAPVAAAGADGPETAAHADSEQHEVAAAPAPVETAPALAQAANRDDGQDDPVTDDRPMATPDEPEPAQPEAAGAPAGEAVSPQPQDPPGESDMADVVDPVVPSTESVATASAPELPAEAAAAEEDLPPKTDVSDEDPSSNTGPDGGAVLTPEQYAPASAATENAGPPRRGWWRRPARQDDGDGDSPGTPGQG